MLSAQKALQGSERETRELLGGTTENSVSLTRGHCLLLPKGNEKIELVARPVSTLKLLYLKVSLQQKDVLVIIPETGWVFMCAEISALDLNFILQSWQFNQ